MRPQSKSGNGSHPIVVVRKQKPQRSNGAAPTRSGQTPVPAQPLAKPSSPRTISPRPLRPASAGVQAQPVLPQSETMPPPPNRRQRKAQAPRALLEVLRTRWPAAFPDDRRQVRPLMRGVHRDIARRLPGTGLWLIKRAILLFQALSGNAYWRAVIQGGPRYALDGSLCGEVTLHEREHATQTLAALAERRQAPRPAAAHRSGTPPATPDPGYSL
jgi:ProQ/FINO family